MTEKEIINLSLDNLSLENILDKPIRTFTEKRNNIDVEKNLEYVEAIIYLKTDDKFIYAKESFDLNMSNSFIFIILSFISSFILYRVREAYSKFDFSAEVRNIKNNHKLEDLEVLKKKLEIRKNNYNRVTGK